MIVAAPTWKWEWNLNTVVVLIGFASGFVAWGWTLNELQTGRATNASGIEKLDVRVARLETVSRLLDNHELRLAAVEAQARDSATATRAVEATLNSLTTDIRVVKEILQRLEASQTGRHPP